MTMRPRLAHAVHQLDSAASVSVGVGLSCTVSFSLRVLAPVPVVFA